MDNQIREWTVRADRGPVQRLQMVGRLRIMGRAHWLRMVGRCGG